MKNNSLHTIYAFWYNPKNGNILDECTKTCIKSFAQLDNPAILYTYGEISNIDGLEGLQILDANEILPFESYFSVDYGALHGFAYFANYFRYNLLMKKKGWWIDTDVIMFNSPDQLIKPETSVAVAYERTSSQGVRRFNNAIIYSDGSGHEFFKDAIESCERQFETLKNTGETGQWGVIGPLLMTELIDKYGHLNSVQQLGRFPFYYNGYMPQDLDRFAYHAIEKEDALLIADLVDSKQIIGAHLWYSAVDWSRIHEKSYYQFMFNVVNQ